MALNIIPLLFVLAGLVLYALLADADFGAGFWQLLTRRDARGQALREQAYETIGPVWEANHVWLIFVLTVTWTAYPVVFGSVASTLAIPIGLAALGLVFRGLAYALHGAANAPIELRAVDVTFAISSILSAFTLGAGIGAIASGRVPVGNAAGNLITSWLNPTSAMLGSLTVVVGALLAAVYLASDRYVEPGLVDTFRSRALAAGWLSGALAVGALAVMRYDASHIYNGLLHGWGLVPLVVAAVSGLSAIGLVYLRLFQPARICAAVAVTAGVAGWAVAQRPDMLPGLTLHEAAAGRNTMIAIIVAVLVGGAILAPSLGLLFRLALAGRLHPRAEPPTDVRAAAARTRNLRQEARLAIAALVAGFALLTIAEAGVAHIFGVLALAAAAVFGFRAVAPADL
jgi:cytochrome d ubiquinol oxidase subunit II